MASPFSLRSDMSYYTNFSSQSYPFYWPTRSPTNNATRSSLYGASDQDGTSNYEEAMLDFATKVISNHATQKWILTIIGCLLVGLSGIFPLLLIPTTKFIRSSDSLSTENSTAKITKQESNIPSKPIANGDVKKVVAKGHHKANGTCKLNGECNPKPVTADNADKVQQVVNVEKMESSPGSEGHNVNKSGISQKTLKRLLSFAIGSLLGDVFLHLLPEAWENAQGSCKNGHDILMKIGIWVLVGIISFLCCEMLVANAGGDDDEEEGDDDEEKNEEIRTLLDPVSSNNNDAQKMNGCNGNGHAKHMLKTEVHLPPAKLVQLKELKRSQKQIAGYLNLVANCFDNFTHGLAVAGSFIVSPKIGIITTAAILLHEIPHEIGDFAILLRSGFNPWSAAKAQLSTALVGLLGAIFTLSCDSMIIGDFTWWILPFTSGCFIQIAMSNILPDLLKEDNPLESCLHFIFILFGIGLMGFVTFIAGV